MGNTSVADATGVIRFTIDFPERNIYGVREQEMFALKAATILTVLGNITIQTTDPS